jgi:hypothetical protein
MAGESETTAQPLQPALAVPATPSSVATAESISDILSDLGDPDVTVSANGRNNISDPKVDGHATSASSPHASSSSPTSASDVATSSNTSPSQGRYDNTVNAYDKVKEASRKGMTSRTVCVAIPVNRKDGTVLMVTSRKHDTKWICRSFRFGQS